MIKLATGPAGASRGHLALVGKGIMYDAGGINLKPGDAMHLLMKHDMARRGAILGAMSAMAALECPTTVTGYLMCTDNMPSGSAMKMGDVLSIHGGKTVEVQNTDAEGRLVMADALVLASERDVRRDCRYRDADWRGAASARHQDGSRPRQRPGAVDQVIAAAERTDERLWQLPLERRYRGQLDSEIADLKNMGDDANAGAITAALFLEEFVGGRPWAHLDIAGTMSLRRRRLALVGRHRLRRAPADRRRADSADEVTSSSRRRTRRTRRTAGTFQRSNGTSTGRRARIRFVDRTPSRESVPRRAPRTKRAGRSPIAASSNAWPTPVPWYSSST